MFTNMPNSSFPSKMLLHTPYAVCSAGFSVFLLLASAFLFIYNLAIFPLLTLPFLFAGFGSLSLAWICLARSSFDFLILIRCNSSNKACFNNFPSLEKFFAAIEN